MTVSPQGRKPLTQPSSPRPGGPKCPGNAACAEDPRYADDLMRGENDARGEASGHSGNFPPTLLRLPNLDPERADSTPDRERSGCGENMGHPLDRDLTGALDRDTTGVDQRWANPPAYHGGTDEFPACSPTNGAKPDTVAGPAGDGVDPALSPGDPAYGDWKPVNDGGDVATADPPPTVSSPPREVPARGVDAPRRVPVRQGTIPAGRSWMEQLGSKSIVVIVLSILAATALLSGRKREPDPSKETVPAHEWDAAGDSLLAPQARIATQSSDPPRKTIERPRATAKQADESGASAAQSEKPSAGAARPAWKVEDSAAVPDTVPSLSLPRATPPLQRTTPSLQRATSGGAANSGGSATGNDIQGNSSERTQSDRDSDGLESGYGADSLLLQGPQSGSHGSSESPGLEPEGSFDSPESATDRFSEPVSPESTTSANRYRRSSTPQAVEDWSRYLPNPATDYIADRSDASDESFQMPASAGSSAGSDEAATAPTTSDSPLQR